MINLFNKNSKVLEILNTGKGPESSYAELMQYTSTPRELNDSQYINIVRYLSQYQSIYYVDWLDSLHSENFNAFKQIPIREIYKYGFNNRGAELAETILTKHNVENFCGESNDVVIIKVHHALKA